MSATRTAAKEVIEHQPLLLPPLTEITPKTLKAYLKAVTLRCQGGDVLLKEEECTSLQLAVAFKTIFLHAEEAVFQTKGGEMILLFSHREHAPLRADEINERFSDAIIAAHEAAPLLWSVANPLPAAEIDFMKFPNANENASTENAVVFIRELLAKITPAYAITLRGAIAPLQLFAACLLLFPRSRTIEYMSGEHNVRII